MFEKVVPISLERHRGKKVRPVLDFRFAADFHVAYLTVHEFSRAAAIYPIVFLEDKTDDHFRPLALLGLQAGENLFVDGQGHWDAAYIPAVVRRYPFALSQTTDSDRYVVCVDEASTLVNDSEGTALFDDAGQPTEMIENVKRYLSELQQMDQVTREFVQFVSAHNLLTPLNMQVNVGGQSRSISGCYVINEERLNNLSDARFVEIRQKGYLPAIYAHLISLSQAERLSVLKDRRLTDQASSPAPTEAISEPVAPQPSVTRVRRSRPSSAKAKSG